MKLGDTCKAGHLVEGADAYRRNSGGYDCGACNRISSLQRYHANKPVPKRRIPASEWCAPEFLKEYVRLTKKMPSAQAKVLILKSMQEAERSRLAAMTPFERQMDAVRRGVAVIDLRASPTIS
jgi:hypothetical protein